MTIFVPGEYRGLYGCSVGNCFVWIDAFGRFLTIKIFLEKLLNLRDTSGAANEHNLLGYR